MEQSIGLVSLVVNDYDEAIAFYRKIGFELKEDTAIDETKRWVVVRPKSASGCGLLLAKAIDNEQKSKVGNQTGGRVFLFLYTDDFEAAYRNLIAQEIQIVREVSTAPYGRVVVFADLYGNLWDLIGPLKKEE